MPQMLRLVSWSAVALAVAGFAWYGVTRHQAGPTTHVTAEKSPDLAAEKPQKVEAPSPAGAAGGNLWAHASSQDAEARFLELRSRAEAGDAAAQRELAELYQRCMVFSLSPSNMYTTLDVFARMRGAPEGAYDNIKKRFATTCSGVDRGEMIRIKTYTTWFKRAAEQGDPYSKVVMATRGRDALNADDFQSLARDVVNSADPEAIFALGDLLVLAPEGTDLAEFKATVTGPYADYAWGIAACRMGADCGPDSFRMDSFCLNTGICNSGDFEHVIRAEAIRVGQQESLNKAIDVVQRVVGKK